MKAQIVRKWDRHHSSAYYVIGGTNSPVDGTVLCTPTQPKTQTTINESIRGINKYRRENGFPEIELTNKIWTATHN